jgi:tetratricopeptide (TPR) repeat protein
MGEPGTIVTAERILALPISEAFSRMLTPDAPAGLVNEILSKLPVLGDDAGRAVVLAAAVLKATRGAAPTLELLDREMPLLQRVPETLLRPAELKFAESVLSDAFTSLEGNVERKSLRVFVELGRILGRCAHQDGDLAAMQDVLGRTLMACEKLEDDQGRILLHIDLGQHLSRAGDRAGAVDHLAYAADLFKRSKTEGSRQEFGEHLSKLLITLGYDLCYEDQRNEPAAQALRLVTELSPGMPEGWFILGVVLSRLEQFEAAAEAYETLTKLQPDIPSAHTNLAAMLIHSGRNDQAALGALDWSLELAPREVRPLLMRGQLRAAKNDPDGGLTDLAMALDLLEADRPPNDKSSPSTVRRYQQHREMWGTAYQSIIQIHQARADRKALRGIAGRLIRTGDGTLGAMGYRLSGDLARVEGEWVSARREYDAALREFDDHEARLARARLAVHLGDIDNAIDDLAYLASRRASPALAIAGLTEARVRSPDRPLILRWLGFAQFESGAFLDSDDTLDQYVERVPTDTEARKWLGLSLISSLPQLGDTPVTRLLKGIDQLARAASEGDLEARDSLVWLLDRLIADDRFLAYASVSPSVASAVPDFTALCAGLHAANVLLGVKRNYPACIEAFERVADSAARLGLICFSAFQRGRLADLKLLSGDIQAAAEEARNSLRQLESVAFTARSPALNEEFQKMVGLSGQYGRKVGLELEHLHVYAYITHAIEIVRAVTARVLARCGDPDGALAALGDVSTIIEGAELLPLEQAVVIAEILNKAGRGEEALTLLERAEAGVSEDADRVSILMTRSTVLLMLGRLNEATSLLKSAAPLLDDAHQWIAWLNLASAAQAEGRDAETLEILSRFDITQHARSDNDLFKYHYSRAAALEGIRKFKEAQQAANQAIEVVEGMRATLKDMNLRASWTAQQQDLFALAIRVAALNDDAGAAFDLLEQSRSRQLLDEIAIGHVPLDEKGRELELRIKQVAQKKELLAEIANSSASGPPQPRLLVKLRALDPALDLTKKAAGEGDTLDPQKLDHARAGTDRVLEAMQADIAQRRLVSAERLFGEVVGWSDMQRLLSRLA